MMDHPMVRLDYYRIFVTAVEEGSFSAAAKRLFLSQPAVSLAIARLEEEIGVRLFHRVSRGVELTHEAREFFEVIRDALERIRRAEEELQEQRHGHQGNLRIGVSDTVSRYLLPDILMRYRRDYPGIRLHIRNGTTSELYKWLMQGETDLGIGSVPEIAPGIHFFGMVAAEDIFVCSKDIAKSLPKRVSMADLSGQRLILLDEKSESRRRLQRLFEEKGYDLQADLEFSSYDLLMDYATRGLGIAGIIRAFFDRHAKKEELVILDLDFQIESRYLGFFHRKDRALSPAAEWMVQLLQSERA